MKNTRSKSKDIFVIQARLFRQFQIREGFDAEMAENVFRKYDVFDYIETCYEEYHVQGDEANLADIYRYLGNKGWKK